MGGTWRITEYEPVRDLSTGKFYFHARNVLDANGVPNLDQCRLLTDDEVAEALLKK